MQGDSRRLAVMIAAGIFATVFATHSKLGNLPLRALIKDDLGLAPDAMSAFFAIAGFAWYVKPLAGILSDRFPIFGSRRRAYILASTASAAVIWTIIALLPARYEPLLAGFVTLSVCVVLGNSALGGLLVDGARAHGTAGSLSAVRVMAMNTSSLIAGPIGGLLAGMAFGVTCAAGASITALAAILGFRLLREPPTDSSSAKPAALKPLLSRTYLSVALLTFVFYGVPGFGTVFYYYQKDSLLLTDQQIGWLSSLSCLGAIAGGVCYARWCKRFELKVWLRVGVALKVASTLIYLLYDSQTAAFVLEPLGGFLGIFCLLPLQELAAKASPAGSEAFGFAAILSVGNLGIALSDLIGARLMVAFGLSLDTLIGICSAAVVLIVVPLLVMPRSSETV